VCETRLRSVKISNLLSCGHRLHPAKALAAWWWVLPKWQKTVRPAPTHPTKALVAW